MAVTMTAQPADRRAGSEGDGPVLEVKNLRRTYGDAVGVEDVSFSIYPGEIVTLLGPSGCGKSTTLRSVMGLEHADGGSIVYRGRVVESATSSVPTHKREMGMVFQSYAIWPHMTVAENVAYPLQLRKWKKAKVADAVREVLRLVGLEQFHDRPATRLSGGQQQRVALARALVYRPGLLLLDEPFSNLDARLRDEMRSEVKAIQREIGIAVLFVTHDQQEALSMSDRIVMMRAGRVLQEGNPEQLYNHPASPLVRDFLGQNLVFPGTVLDVAGDRVTSALGKSGVVVTGEASGYASRPQVGDACEISIRPEQIHVERTHVDDPEAPLPANHVLARVTASLFLGDRRELQIETPRGQKARVYAPLADRHVEGEYVLLDLPEAHVRIWPTGPAEVPASAVKKEGTL